MSGMLAVVVITEAVASNVSFLKFYTKSGRSGYDNICDIGGPRWIFQNRTFASAASDNFPEIERSAASQNLAA